MDIDEMEIDVPNDEEEPENVSNCEESEKFDFLVIKLKKSKSKRKANVIPLVMIEQILSDQEDQEIDDSHTEDDDSEEDDDSGRTVDFGAPETSYEDDDSEISNINIDQGFVWIVYWILKYQERYRLSDTATESLVKFIRYLLILHDDKTYSKFPKSLNMACKLFGIGDKIIRYATCPKCCKLYSLKDLKTDKPYHCSYKDFPNHPISSFRSPCNTVITKPVPETKGIVHKPALIYPIINIKDQLQRLYNKKGFEESCRKWSTRPINDRELSDIYDGKTWKTFKDPNDGQLFFRHDVSDSHLGIMLNLDWFQPFDNSQYSVRVMYGVICNLPRSERFKTPNILTLAVIPGPNEPKLHQLNHYLAPIVDQFI